MIAGQIEIQMMADLARLKKDMDEAKGIVGNAAAAMGSAMDFVKGAIGGMVAGLSVHAFTGWLKAAIDAGDATKEFAQKTGIAAKDVAGLQLAFKQGGVEGDALTGSISKLSKQMVAGNDAFKQLGVETRNTDGTLRNVKDVLYDTAEAFSGIKDGAAKSALAQEVFGKSGAALIPTLNEGADGLREMADMAEKLGLVISEDVAEQSDKFNDTMQLISMSSQGLARQVIAEVLPTLNSLAGAFLKSKTEGDGMHRTAEVISSGLKLLYTVVAGGVEVFNTFGKTLGALGAQLVALAQGDFKGVMSIGKEWMADIKNNWTGTIKSIGTVWDGSAAKTVDAGVKMVKAQRDISLATDASKASTDKAAAAEAKRAEEVAKLIDKISASAEVMQYELDVGGKLTAAQKEALDVMIKLRDGTLQMTDAEKAELVVAIEAKIAVEARTAAQADYLKTIAAVSAETSKLADIESKTTEGMRATVVQLIEENDKLRLGEQAWQARQAAVLESQAQDLEWQAANAGGNFQLEEQARLLRQRASLMQEGVVLKEAKATADEWKRTTDSLNSGLTDALLRAFESGKGFAKAFRDMLVNAFKTLVLQPAINFIVSPITGAVTAALAGVFGTGAATAGTGGGSSALGTGASVASLFGSGGIFGSLTAGAGWLTGGTSLMGSLTAAGSLIATGTSGGIMAGLGMGAGALGPIALGLAALSMLDKKSTPHVGGYAMADAAGGIADITAAQGGTQNANSQAAVASLAGTVSAILNGTGGAFGMNPGVSVRSVFESDNNDPSWGLFHLLNQAGAKLGGSFDALGTLNKDSTQGFAEYAAQAAGATLKALGNLGLPQWAMDEFNKLGASATLDQIATVAASVVDKVKNPAATSTSTSDPLDSPLRAADPSPMWQEMADNAKATRTAAEELTAKVSTAEGQDTALGVMVDGMNKAIDRLDATVARLMSIDARLALQEARAT